MMLTWLATISVVINMFLTIAIIKLRSVHVSELDATRQAGREALEEAHRLAMQTVDQVKKAALDEVNRAHQAALNGVRSIHGR